MKFLLDSNLPYSAKDIFPKHHQVFHTRDLNLQHATDDTIILWARKNKAGLITRDFDFANIINFPPKKYFGIVVLKLPYFYTALDIKRVLGDFIPKMDEISIPKSTIIMEETRFRIRR